VPTTIDFEIMAILISWPLTRCSIFGVFHSLRFRDLGSEVQTKKKRENLKIKIRRELSLYYICNSEYIQPLVGKKEASQ